MASRVDFFVLDFNTFVSDINNELTSYIVGFLSKTDQSHNIYTAPTRGTNITGKVNINIMNIIIADFMLNASEVMTFGVPTTWAVG